MSTAADQPAAPGDATAAAQLLELVEHLRGDLRGLAQRLDALEARQAVPAAMAAASAAPAAVQPGSARSAAAVTEDDMLVIAAAVAAYLGVRAQIRQVRLVQSAAWAQVGRATIHASHRI